MKVSQRHQALHDRALELSKTYRDTEKAMIKVLQEIQRTKAYVYFDSTSLFQYAVKKLNLSESQAYTFTAVAKATNKIPQLKELSVHQASRILSVVNKENAEELITFAKTHTQRELDFEVARRNPKKRRTSAKPTAQDTVRLATDIKKSTYEKILRAQTLMSKTQTKELTDVFEQAIEEWLHRHDPKRKAQKAKLKQDFCANRTGPINSAEKQAVDKRDEGQCTFIHQDGERCQNERWLHTHHIIHRANGGTNNPENLTTLCSTHHMLVHQLSLPIDGQISWLREPAVPYTADFKYRVQAANRFLTVVIEEGDCSFRHWGREI